MSKTSETILFFGSGPVAASALSKLAKTFVIEAVITKPKPAHYKADFPVITVANNLGLKIYTATNKNELNELFSGTEFTSQIGIVIDYGIIISQTVIDKFKYGIINSHFSLLPKFRGADPISFAILSGDNETGVSLMRIVEALDEGPLLDQRRLLIGETDDNQTLTEKLIALSQQMLEEDIPRYLSGEIKPVEQSNSDISYTSLLTKQDGLVDWQKPASAIEKQIRAYSGWPRSRVNLAGIDVIITKAHITKESGKPGKSCQVEII